MFHALSDALRKSWEGKERQSLHEPSVTAHHNYNNKKPDQTRTLICSQECSQEPDLKTSSFKMNECWNYIRAHTLGEEAGSLEWNLWNVFFIGNGFLPCSNLSHGYGLALRVSDGERLLLIFEAYKEKCDLLWQASESLLPLLIGRVEQTLWYVTFWAANKIDSSNSVT